MITFLAVLALLGAVSWAYIATWLIVGRVEGGAEIFSIENCSIWIGAVVLISKMMISAFESLGVLA